jgi:hypothetical protein
MALELRGSCIWELRTRGNLTIAARGVKQKGTGRGSRPVVTHTASKGGAMEITPPDHVKRVELDQLATTPGAAMGS